MVEDMEEDLLTTIIPIIILCLGDGYGGGGGHGGGYREGSTGHRYASACIICQ